MSPKEKALQLIDKFYALITHEYTSEYGRKLAHVVAKQSALISVNEIIEAAIKFDDILFEIGNVRMSSNIEYWQEVLQHLKSS